MELTFQELKRELKQKQFKPVYLLYGEEAYFIDQITEYMEKNVLSDSEKGFNQSVVYGAETNFNELMSSLKRYPVMSNYQLIILKEAQRMKDVKKLISYLESPVSSTILVINYRKKTSFIDKRSKSFKNMKSGVVFMNAQKLYEDKIPGWINEYVKSRGYLIDPQTSMILTSNVGADLLKLTNELEKVMINVKHGQKIEPSHIEKYIGISKEYNIFEFQNALGNKDHERIYRMLSVFKSNPKEHHILKYIGALYSFYVKIFKYHELKNQDRGVIAKSLGVNPYFLKDYAKATRNYNLNQTINAIQVLHQYDLKSKGVNSGTQDSYQLFKEMVFKLLS